MKKIFNRLYALMFTTVSFATVSCSENIMDKVNEDIDHPTEVPSMFMITDIENSFAVNIVGGDLSFYALSYTEHEVGVYNQLYSAEIRGKEPSSSTTYNNPWQGLYSNLEALRQMGARCDKGGVEEGNAPTLGMSQILTALYLGVLTDCFGDVPWSEALKLSEGIYQPKIDTQESIYATIFDLLEKGTANLALPNTSVGSPVGSQDFIYKGDVKMWTKFASSLKARYLMRLSKVKPDYDAVLTAIESGFASAKEEAKLTFFDDNANVSPYSAFYYSRDYMAVSESFMKKLEEREDIRAEEFIAGPDKYGNYNEGAAPNGDPIQVQGHYYLPTSAYDGAAPFFFMSYHELMFIKAEALQRKGAASADIEKAFKSAYLAGAAKHAGINDRLTKTGSALTPVVAEKSFTDVVLPLFEANPLKELAIQKYIALYQDGESLEAYNDVRRNMAMGNDVYELQNKNNRTKFPFRYPYGADDVTTNQHVRDAYGDGSYVYSTPVWWAGGNR